MLQARHNRWADQIFKIYLGRLCRRHFRAITLTNEPPLLSKKHPLLLLPNHSTWWDGFVVYLLNRSFLRRPFYLMMLERELRKFPFFQRLGAYSIAPASPKKILTSLQYTLEIFSAAPSAMVCMFPQGELLPFARRPLAYRPGIEWLLQRCPPQLSVLPVGIRAEFLGDQRPEIFVRFGSPAPAQTMVESNLRQMEALHETLLDELQADILQGRKAIELLRGESSINNNVERLSSLFYVRRSP